MHTKVESAVHLWQLCEDGGRRMRLAELIALGPTHVAMDGSGDVYAYRAEGDCHMSMMTAGKTWIPDGGTHVERAVLGYVGRRVIVDCPGEPDWKVCCFKFDANEAQKQINKDLSDNIAINLSEACEVAIKSLDSGKSARYVNDWLREKVGHGISHRNRADFRQLLQTYIDIANKIKYGE